MTGPHRGDREATLARTFVMLADTLVDDFDVTDLFDRLTGACVELLGAAAAGLMLVDQHGALQLMASSSEAMRALELFEMSHDQGPCMDCYANGQPVSADLHSVEAATRWPQFTAEALGQSITAVQALPMRLRGQTIGALNIFQTTGARLEVHDTALAQALADIATIALLQRHALTSTELLSEQLQEALNDRVVIEQVKGLLAERGQLDVDLAFGLLRGYCRASRLPLTRTAREIVTGERDADDILARRWPAAPQM
jgi:GAF domain-containing protein